MRMSATSTTPAGTTFADDGQLAQLLQRVANLARVAHVDREALQAFHRLADVVAAHRRGDDRLHVGDVHAEARRRVAVDRHVDVAPAGQPLGQGAADAGHVLQHLLDLAGHAVDGRQVGAGHLDAHRALDAGGQHVDAVADRRHPDVGQARHLDDAVEFLDQLVLRHAGAPLALRLELDRGLEHLQWRRVGGRLGAAGLAVHAGTSGTVLIRRSVCCSNSAGLAGRQAGQRRRHVQQVTFVQPRHELAADVLQRPQARHQRNGGDHQRELRRAQHHVQQRPVDRDQGRFSGLVFSSGMRPRIR
jgi:hypothetical protein